MAVMTPLGAELRRKRRELGLTQAQAAEVLDVSQQTVGKWELGETRPTTREPIERIAEFLGITVQEAAMLTLPPQDREFMDVTSLGLKLDEVLERVTRLEELVGASGVTRQYGTDQLAA
jgi:transcriptional regulator with XRE-family HTH domain